MADLSSETAGIEPAWQIKPILPWPSWILLRGIGKQQAVRSSYFWLIAVPLAARMLAKFPPEYEVHLLGSVFTLTFALPFSWKVFYFSSVAIAIGTAIYSSRCPDLIKDWNDYTDFERDGKSSILLTLAMRSNARMWSRQSELVTYLIQFCGADEDELGSDAFSYQNIEVDRDQFPNAFHFTQGVVSLWHPTSRLICAICYLVGFVLLAVVFLDTLWFVINFTAER